MGVCVALETYSQRQLRLHMDLGWDEERRRKEGKESQQYRGHSLPHLEEKYYIGQSSKRGETRQSRLMGR